MDGCSERLNMIKVIKKRIEDSVLLHKALLDDERIQNEIMVLSNAIILALNSNHKIVVCGNGGSASDSLHFVAEIIGRFQKERNAWPAIALNSDVSTMTAIANDYGYEKVFARQAEAVVNEGDVFIGISTSGNSQNVINAVKTAQKKGAKTAALLGKDGGALQSEVDYPVLVN